MGDKPLNFKKMKNLFLRQSYLDSWTDYESSLTKPSFIKWDYLVLTASNEEQARTYREQIDYRLKQGRLRRAPIMRCFRIRTENGSAPEEPPCMC